MLNDSKKLNLPPGKLGLPLIGETISLIRNPRKFIQKRFEKNGAVFKTHILGNPTAFVTGAKGNQWVFSGENKYLRNHWPKSVQGLLGENCLNSIHGKEHKNRRKIMAPFFERKKVLDAFDTIANVVNEFIEKWDTQEILDLRPTVRALTFRVMVEIIFGENRSKHEKLRSEFVKYNKGFISALPLNLPFLAYGKALKSKKVIANYILAAIEERRHLDFKGGDILGNLLEAKDEQGTGLNDNAIVNELTLSLFAGHDTTITSLSNVMLLLVQHPQVLEKCVAEISDLPINRDTINSFTYLDQVIKESLRLLPPAGAAFRRTTTEVEYEGFTIPKGWTVAISMWNSHYHPDHFLEAEKFNPDRFEKGFEEDKKTPCSYIAFGGGPRACIGMHMALLELKIILSKIIQRYDFSLVSGQDLTYSYIPFTQPKNSLKFQIKKKQ